MRRSLRLPALALLAAGVLAVAGCGKSGPTSVAETEGIYLDLGGMTYQVQISRFLNPHDTEDSAYLKGLPQGTEVGRGETWFGVFMRVQNETDHALPAATDYEITDTQDHVYRPVPLDPKSNSFAYQGGMVEPDNVLPLPDSPAGFSPIQGALVLFKLKVDDLQNRPLDLHISSGPQGASVTQSLDL